MPIRRLSPRRILARSGSSPSARLLLQSLEGRTLLSTAAAPAVAPLAVDTEAYEPHRILVRFRPEPSVLIGADIPAGTELGRAFDLVPGLHEVELADGVSVADAVAAY